MQHNDIRLTAGAHTKANRNIEYITQKENSTEEEANNNGSNTGMVRSTVRGNLYADFYTMASNTGVLEGAVLLEETEQTNNIRPLVVVTVRGSVTFGDWMNNVLTQLYPLDNRFVALKDEIADNLESYISEISDLIILATGHSLGAAVANLISAMSFSGHCTFFNVWGMNFIILPPLLKGGGPPNGGGGIQKGYFFK